MKRIWSRWPWILGAVAALAAGAFLVVASGLIPLKASSGHWAATEWFLHFAMQRSVATHSLGLKPPDLDEAGLVAKGAGHYETGCRPCHGSPEMPHPRIPRAMTPHPPYLPPVISEYEPRELFYIVKHGVKFTGMPAWPAQQRDDEVWAMVAFLITLPGLDGPRYRRLAGGGSGGDGAPAVQSLTDPHKMPAFIAESCARCHGADGGGGGSGAFPRLAGQKPLYLAAALQAYAAGERHSGIMEPVAAGLRREQMGELGSYYARLRAPAAAPDPDREAIERGRAIARDGIPEQRVPACAECHGPGAIRRNPYYPLLSGQHAGYLLVQLRLFRNRQRGGSPYAHLMHEVAPGLNPGQMRDVTLFYQSLPAEDEK